MSEVRKFWVELARAMGTGGPVAADARRLLKSLGVEPRLFEAAFRDRVGAAHENAVDSLKDLVCHFENLKPGKIGSGRPSVSTGSRGLYKKYMKMAPIQVLNLVPKSPSEMLAMRKYLGTFFCVAPKAEVGGVGDGAEVKEDDRWRLVVKSILCNEQEDWIGHDDVYFVYSISKIGGKPLCTGTTNTYKLRAGQSIVPNNCNLYISDDRENLDVTVRMYEADGYDCSIRELVSRARGPLLTLLSATPTGIASSVLMYGLDLLADIISAADEDDYLGVANFKIDGSYEYGKQIDGKFREDDADYLVQFEYLPPSHYSEL